ncbi:MAG: hypothetical protein HOY44_06910 [Maritimibacter sp.]|uniref:hypothetical protein n=1 Tax=Maritimibacter sp. TaxID=2003363 RepID=UPI001DB0B6C0|nr:hypothetical protein [Maritimibacter sp.]MBL6427242.1 hypothetical protein [Maritimibacter sp.]
MTPLDVIELTIGAVIVVYVFVDFIFTTIGTNVYFFVSHRLARGVFALHRTLPDMRWKYHVVGPLCMSVVAIWWIAGLAVGWTMILHALEPGILRQEPETPASLIGALSHAGHMLSTVGGGITKAGSMASALLGVTAAVTGMVVLTLSVSFILSTTQTVLAGRSLLMLTHAIPPEDVDFKSTILPDVASLVSNINSAPFALFYSHPEPEMRLPGALASLYRQTEGDTRAALDRILSRIALVERLDGPGDLDDWAKQYDIASG